MSRFGLSSKEEELISGVFKGHPEIQEARIYGSRAKGNHAPNSDIDIVFWGEIDSRLLGRIASELDELPLPYRFDASIYSEISNEKLRAHIDRVGAAIYRREPANAIRINDS